MAWPPPQQHSHQDSSIASSSQTLNGAVHETQYYGCAAIVGNEGTVEEQLSVLRPDRQGSRLREKPLVKHMNLVVSVYGITGLSMVKKGVLRKKKGTMVFNLRVQQLTRCENTGQFTTLITTARDVDGIATDKHTAYFFKSADATAATRLTANIATACEMVHRGVAAYAKLVGVIEPARRMTGTPPVQRANLKSWQRPASLLVPASPQVQRAQRISLQEGIEGGVIPVMNTMLEELREGQRAQSMSLGDECFRGSNLNLDGEAAAWGGFGPSSKVTGQMDALYPEVVRYAKLSAPIATKASAGPMIPGMEQAAAGLTRRASQQFLEQLGQYVVNAQVAQT